MTLTESDIITAVQAYTWISVQTSAEATAGSNTTANLLYNSQSRNQGNFSVFYSTAGEQITDDEGRLGITLSDNYKKQAYAYLIAYYFERRFKDWNATALKSGDDSVSRSENGMLKSYQDVLLTAINSSDIGLTDSDLDILEHTDSLNYPDELKDSQMDNVTIEFEQ